MKVLYYNLKEEFQMTTPMVACIGYFDGLHLGHQKLIETTKKLAQAQNVDSCLISFVPDPLKVILKLETVKHINSLEERIEIIKEFGIDKLILLEFDQQMANLSVLEFSNLILKKLHLQTLVVGFDFKYAKNKSGNYQTLVRDNDFNIIEIPEVKYLNEKISTTRIIKCLNNRQIEEANKMLNYHYFIQGVVISGHQKGRTIGFPTCILKVSKEVIIPKEGIYIGYVKYQNQYFKAMINIGHNPTFNYVNQLSIEAHILDFNQNIYGENLIIYFNQFISPEAKYADVNDLIKALEEYKKMAAKQPEFLL